MQFKHPEILYALLLLIIPIIIHLFQLRKFQKVAFTNVQFLKELTIQTRKSSQLKKWLTLLTRMLLLACVIIAFAQPYISNSESFNTKSETVIYLDNSFSMQAQGSNGTLLNSAIQDVIENMDENEAISIFTNDASFYNTSIKAIKNDIIQLKHSPGQLGYDAVLLKGKNAFSEDKSTIKNLVLISDFQQKEDRLTIPADSSTNVKLVQLKPANVSNITIDSLYISKSTVENLELTVKLKNQGEPIETLPVSLFNDDKLIAKSAVTIENETSTIFTIPANSIFNGKITIEDTNLQYDNELYFNIDQREPIKVLAINEADDTFLKKIYTNDEFDYMSAPFNALNYNSLDDQNLIVLNELKEIPLSLITALKAFTDNGGNLLIIPSNNSTLNTYNQLFTNYNLSGFSSLNPKEKRVTTIHFSHPVLANVFDKQIRNFQYPKVNSLYSNASSSGTAILSYEDGSSFLSQSENVYRFSAALNSDNSNFKNSPLIVPVLYNIGKQSLKVSKLYYTLGEENSIDVTTKLQQDDILTLVNGDNTVIPLQQTYTNKVALKTSDYPNTSGIIAVKNKDTFLKNLSFNFNRNESNLSYLNLNAVENATVNDSITSTINDIKSATNVNELWKWFVIFALAFLIIEMLILKFLK
ncbi:BatA domain-containing protein [Psychroserpens mesophilus]|uniref:BatA domain-containing protein n=1 Tax=Psychroserpens mesophilus TaxID=325473 RepID=UPI003F499B9B